MKAKEYLQQLRRMDTAIGQKIRELEDLRAIAMRAGGVRYAENKARPSYTDAPYSRVIDRMVDLDAEINREIDGFVDKKHKMINQIQRLPNGRYAEILYKRYVEYKQLEMISAEMHYTYQYTKELHGYALQEFERTYPNLP